MVEDDVCRKVSPAQPAVSDRLSRHGLCTKLRPFFMPPDTPVPNAPLGVFVQASALVRKRSELRGVPQAAFCSGPSQRWWPQIGPSKVWNFVLRRCRLACFKRKHYSSVLRLLLSCFFFFQSVSLSSCHSVFLFFCLSSFSFLFYCFPHFCFFPSIFCPPGIFILSLFFFNLGYFSLFSVSLFPISLFMYLASLLHFFLCLFIHVVLSFFLASSFRFFFSSSSFISSIPSFGSSFLCSVCPDETFPPRALLHWRLGFLVLWCWCFAGA